LAAQLGQRDPAIDGTQRLPVEQNLARVRLDETDQQTRGRRLAAAGFADDAERFALRDLEIDAIDGLHQLGIEPTRIGQQLATILGSPAEKQPRYDRYRSVAR
jgi:hypothetical protein